MVGKKHPVTYMRKGSFVPCDCKKCYFVSLDTQVLFAGWTPKKRKAVIHFKCGARQVTEACTDFRVDLGLPSADYCRMWYRQMDPSLSSKEKKKHQLFEDGV